ncbi:MAG: O-antigen ligase family protein [Geobacteraceae bacterium]
MDKIVSQHKNSLSVPEIIGWIVAGAVISLLLLSVPLNIALLMVGGLLILAVTATRPEIGILSIVVLISSIVFGESLGLIPIGIGSLHIADVMLLYMLFLIIRRHFGHEDLIFISTPLDKWLVLFMVTVIISALLSILHYGVDFNDVMRQVRHLTYYLIFFIVTNLITTKEQMVFVIRGLLAISVVVAITMVLQAIVGESVQLMPGRVEAAMTFGRAYDATRILPPGQTLLFVMFITSFCFLCLRSEKNSLQSGYFYVLTALSVGILLTYNRNYWVAAIFCLAILLMMLPFKGKKKLIAVVVLLVMISGMGILLFDERDSKFNQTVLSISDRFTSLFTGKELIKSRSLEIRRLENKYALAKIAEHPVLGIGLGNTYRPIFWKNDTLTYYMENGYYWILTDMGIPGLLFFMMFYLRFLVRAFRNRTAIRDDYLRAALTGFMLSGVGILPMVIVNPIFMQWFSIVVISLCIGLSENIIRLNATEPEPSTNS